MNSRIMALRKRLGLSQQEFADRIGASRGVIANIDNNRTVPSQIVISSICRVFNVNPEWLKDGADVPMFLEVDDDDDLLINRIMAGEDEFRKSVFRAFARLDDDSWALLKSIVDQFKKADR